MTEPNRELQALPVVGGLPSSAPRCKAEKAGPRWRKDPFIISTGVMLPTPAGYFAHCCYWNLCKESSMMTSSSKGLKAFGSFPF